jgi:hypothetical protein
MACESIEVDGKGGNTLVMRIGHVRDAVHLVWWMTNIMHFSFVLVLLAFAKIFALPLGLSEGAVALI